MGGGWACKNKRERECYLCTYIDIVCECVCIDMYMYVYVHVCMCICVYICIYIYIHINGNYITIRDGKANTKKYLFLYQICIIAKYYSVFCNRDAEVTRDDERMPVRACNRALSFLRRRLLTTIQSGPERIARGRLFKEFRSFLHIDATGFRLVPFPIARPIIVWFSWLSLHHPIDKLSIVHRERERFTAIRNSA